MFQAKLTFQDGKSLSLALEDGETLAAAAARLEQPMRYDCLSGDCGACVCRISEGTTESDDTTLLTEEERHEGLALGCQTRLTSDAVIELEYPLEPTPSEAGRHDAELIAVERLNPTTSRLVMMLDEDADLRFAAGQYVRLRPPGLRVARPYSIASSPADLPRLELLIRHVSGGQVSGWLENGAEVGQTVRLQAPLGGFALDSRSPVQIFIGGGTGLSPLLSMIRDAEGEPGKRILCFGVTTAADLFYVDELRALEASRSDLEVRIAVFNGAADAVPEGVAVGTAVDLVKADDLVEGCAIHMCGPPAMVTAARALLRGHGVPSHAIRAERFAASA